MVDKAHWPGTRFEGGRLINRQIAGEESRSAEALGQRMIAASFTPLP
jgi:hypothetical protein